MFLLFDVGSGFTVLIYITCPLYSEDLPLIIIKVSLCKKHMLDLCAQICINHGGPFGSGASFDDENFRIRL